MKKLCKNIINDFPDLKFLKPGKWSNYGKFYEYENDKFIEINVYREPIEDNNEYSGRLTLHIFDGDEVILCKDIGE